MRTSVPTIVIARNRQPMAVLRPKRNHRVVTPTTNTLPKLERALVLSTRKRD